MSAPEPATLLASQRARIDALDGAMVALLAQRFAVVEEVAVLKAEAGVAARLEARVEQVVAGVRGHAEAAGCPADLAEHVWRAMMDWIIDYEDRRIAETRAGRTGDA